MTPDHERRSYDIEFNKLSREVSQLIGKFDEYLKSTDKICALHGVRTTQLEDIIKHHEEQIQKVLVAAEAFAKHEEDEKWKWRTSLTASFSTLAFVIGNIIWDWIKNLMGRK